MDDTFVIHKEANKQGFLQHINSVDPAIRFTVEDNKEDGSIPVLDTIVKPEVDSSLSITVYRKPTHTDQYLQWDSHHHLSAKFSVIQTLSHRASTVCSNPELLQKEKDHLRKALTKCNYPKWALDKVEKRLTRSTRQVNDEGNNTAQSANPKVQSKGHIVIPYTQGLCESIRKICGGYGIQTHFKGGKTKTICSNPQLLKQEDHLYTALSRCKYPAWALNRIKIKSRNLTKKKNNNNQNKNKNKSGTDTIQKPHIIVPYHRWFSESFKKVCSNHGVQVYFKGGTTIKNLLMAPKDQDPMKKRSGIIYRYKCNRVECNDEYIAESSRTFGERFKELLKVPYPIFDHYKTTGHQVSIENFSIVGRVEQNLMRAIKEALYIRVNNPSLNRNIGKYHLPHIWDEVLFNTSELKLK